MTATPRSRSSSQDTPAEAPTGEPPEGASREVTVRGARLPCVVQGAGTPLFLLHGALSDHRMWVPHRGRLAGGHRVVTISQRFFGTSPWQADWPPFGVSTHADDLVDALQQLADGPAHLVAWSYAAHVALTVALRRPDLLRSLFLYEPGVPTYVTDPAEQAAFRADAEAMYGPIFAAVREGAGDLEAVRRLMDGSSQTPGYFDAQPEARRALQIENARTMSLLMAQAPPPVITPEDLATLRLPVCIAQGERTRPAFAVVSRAAARCIQSATHLVIPGAGHMWPDEDPEAFAAAVLDFLGAAARS